MSISPVLCLDTPDLDADLDAVWSVKDELVTVEFAITAGSLESAVGTNRYEPGDALLTGSTGDRWCVSRARFDAKYRPEPPTPCGHSGRYRNLPVAVRAKRMAAPFRVARTAGGDLLCGAAGDWLMQYAPGDYGIVAQDRFVSVYRVLQRPPS
jgi:PGDYG protein